MYTVVVHSLSGRRLWIEDVFNSHSEAEEYIKRRKESGSIGIFKIRAVKSRGFAELVCAICWTSEFFDLDEMPKTWRCDGQCERSRSTEGIVTPGEYEL